MDTHTISNPTHSDYLFLPTPIKSDGKLLQYLGQVLRPASGKEKAKVYDYIDSQVGVLKAAATAGGGFIFGEQNL